jgi:hypothetical protein
MDITLRHYTHTITPNLWGNTSIRPLPILNHIKTFDIISQNIKHTMQMINMLIEALAIVIPRILRY